jgi:hypothetical protein
MFEVRLSPLELDEESGLSRAAPRPEHLRQPSYDQEFDDRTIFYDLFWSPDGRQVVGIGPPLANLAEPVFPLLRRGLRGSIFSRLEQRNLERCWEVWIRRCRARPSFPAGIFRQSELAIQPNHLEIFRGKKVALTKSRDNQLVWIRDWAYFLAKAHGCNAVLFYDNASTNASPSEIQQTIASVPGIETVVVVSWPYKFGPQGIDRYTWDSDFCQYGILEHARFRFLADALAVLQVDIDEFPIPEAGKSVFDLANAASYIRFDSRWIESVTDEMPPAGPRRHRDYRYYDAVSTPGRVEKKWAVVPNRCPRSAQWLVHRISHMASDGPASAGVLLRHFKGINTNWREDRWHPERFDPARHRIDEELVKWFGIFDELPTI